MKKNDIVLVIISLVLGVGSFYLISNALLGLREEDEVVVQADISEGTESTGSSAATSSVAASASTHSIVVNENNTSDYRDGIYTSSQVSYTTHGYSGWMQITITLQSGTVVGFDNSYAEGNETSLAYQDSFDHRLELIILGENVDDIAFSRTASASPTTGAFIRALEEIKSDAKI